MAFKNRPLQAQVLADCQHVLTEPIRRVACPARVVVYSIHRSLDAQFRSVEKRKQDLHKIDLLRVQAKLDRENHPTKLEKVA